MILWSDWSMLLEFLEDLQQAARLQNTGFVDTLFSVVSNDIKCIALMKLRIFIRMRYKLFASNCWGLTYTPLISSASRSREDKTRTGGHRGRCGTASNRKGTSLIFLPFPAPSFPQFPDLVFSLNFQDLEKNQVGAKFFDGITEKLTILGF